MQIFPEMVPEVDIAETFKRRKNERDKSLAETQLHTKSNSSEEFRESLFLYCEINLKIY